MDSTARDLVVIGGSAGSVGPLKALVAGLSAELPVAVLVVLHTAASSTGTLAALLSRAGPFPAEEATDGEEPRAGRIYIARPDHHLLIDRREGSDLGNGSPTEIMRVVRGPRINRVRPAVDPLFRSAARWRGPRVIGVVLSGTLDDGAVGAATIAAQGGAVLVQDPGEAQFGGMPAAARVNVPGAAVGESGELGQLITELAGVAGHVTALPDEDLIVETEMNAGGPPGRAGLRRDPGVPAGLGCPDCGGGMNVIETQRAVHYRCHVGHAFSPQTLAAAQGEGVETALWKAVSVLQEKAAVHARMAGGAAERGHQLLHREFSAKADEAATAAQLIMRKFLATG
ncbi:chemotaxis protein CheB [Actinomadura barringtoniae]|uniref:protein-glutamate methylesterase n=1 Tax=Actinomadura barringtoniae TaxID=1427535 RepID=A0A939T871_9ACTN|nr:chemotaxis protein CheB [Actinomadura barringtoniae]MBO2453833.1 chemotaxis protein CheB [Actinomadura barringtoniae]